MSEVIVYDRPIPRKGEPYRHYKGGRYVVVCIAKEERTGLPQVVYQAVDSGHIWVRPLSEFLGEIKNAEYPAGIDRFTLEHAI